MEFSFQGSLSDRRGDVDAEKPALALTNFHGAQILIVDDDLAHRKLLALMMEQVGLTCRAVPGAKEALNLLQGEHIDAVIADLNMPGVSGLELLTEVRRRHANLVFLMATGVDDVRLGVHAMRQGADDYLIKPLQMDAVVLSLDRAFQKKCLERELEDYRRNLEQMVCQRTVELQNALTHVEQSYADTLDALGAAIDLRDGQTAGHSRRVVLWSLHILSRMQGTQKQLKDLAMGAWLHDIGKLAIPDAILLKPGALTVQEWKIMQNHAQIGYDLVNRIPFLADAAEIVLTHHERWDGSGYPCGLKGTDIPIGARIFAVADTVDAMTSDRPYRAALPFVNAQNEIERLAGIQFDSRVVDVFLQIPNETWETFRGQTSTLQISAALAGVSIGN
jgi:response regulator RpfG family c-di-GMP phosphodiesterase